MPLKLIVANKAYSSWSQRAWILLAHFKIPFEETVIPLDLPDTHAKILKHSPSGKVPALIDGPITVWESLAIIEYVAETHPEKAIWPRGKAARAHARSLAAEMHAGFHGAAPGLPGQLCPAGAEDRDIRRRSRPTSRGSRRRGRMRARRFGKAGPFLFGRFSAADAMFAPVVNRFHTYDISVPKTARDYMAAMMALPAWKAWIADAEAEEWRIEKYDAI